MAKILFVDRDSEMRSIFCLALSSEHIIMEASTGHEGLSIFQSFQPNIVIVDLNIPVVSGFDFVKNLRTAQNKEKLKIIAISGSFRYPAKCNQMLMAGADLCLSKPVTIATIKDSIANLLTISHVVIR